MKKTIKKDIALQVSLLLFICFILFWLNYTGFFEDLAVFFEKISFRFFGSTNEFARQFPPVFITLLPIGVLFSYLEKIKDENFAKIVCLIALIPLVYVAANELSAADSIGFSFFLSVLFLFLSSISQKKLTQN